MFRLLILAALVASTVTVTNGTEAASVIVTVGLDMEVSGNGPRSADDIDQCISVPVGQPATVDVAIPDPGVPAERGVSAYQFTLFYDGTTASLTGDDHEMLLDEAPGSSLIPVAEAKPDTDGVYTSGVVDFGPKGIEPAGASEIGPGVLARLTLTPHSAGVSGLVVKDVIIKDDAGRDIEIISILSAHLYAGEPCPGQTASTPTPTAPPASTAQPPATRTAAPRLARGGPAPSPAELIQTGGSPGGSGGQGAPLVGVAGLSVVAGMAAMSVAWSGRRRL